MSAIPKVYEDPSSKEVVARSSNESAESVERCNVSDTDLPVRRSHRIKIQPKTFHYPQLGNPQIGRAHV